jgi:hypothetical protein
MCSNQVTPNDTRSAARNAGPQVTVVAVLSFVVLLLAMPRDLNMYDEGIILSDAIRVIHGEMTHRDFYSPYGPAQYYAIAAIFKFFGENFIFARLYDLVVRAATVTILFYIIRRQCSLLIALIFTAIGGLWLMAIGNYFYPIFPCILLSLVSSYLVTQIAKGPAAWPRIIIAGVCTGLTALFRYDVGFLLLVAHLVAMTTIIMLSKRCEAKTRRALTAMAAYSAGTAVIFVPAAIIFLLTSPIGSFVTDIFDYPIKYYAIMRRLPFPGLHALRADPASGSVYLPVLAGGLALIVLIRVVIRRIGSPAARPGDDSVVAYLMVFGSTAATLFLKGVVRVSAIHMLLGIVPALVVFALLVKLWWQRGTAMRIAAAFVLVLVLSPTVVAARRELRTSFQVVDRSIAGWLALQAGLVTLPVDSRDTCEAGPASGIARLSPDYSRVATYLGAHSRPDERIFVALDRHDKVFANPISLYFAVGRLPGTHWHEFDPGLQTRADIQGAIISDLQRNKVRWIVRDGNFDDVTEPNGSALSSGVTLLDRFIAENYREVASSGKVTIWLANGETPVDANFIGKCEATPVPSNS